MGDRMVKSVQEMVTEFHQAFGMAIDYTGSHVERLLDLRGRLISEEAGELGHAMQELVDLAATAGDETDWTSTHQQALKETCDLVYVLVGTAVSLGWDFDEAFARVHASNMAKVWPDGTVRKREDGKVLKPPEYEAPDLGSCI